MVKNQISIFGNLKWKKFIRSIMVLVEGLEFLPKLSIIMKKIIVYKKSSINSKISSRHVYQLANWKIYLNMFSKNIWKIITISKKLLSMNIDKLLLKAPISILIIYIINMTTHSKSIYHHFIVANFLNSRKIWEKKYVEI